MTQTGSDPTFPLIPRDRLLGLAFGALTSVRRGRGSDVAGSRPYQPGDDVRAIDWRASARLSSARGTDEFVVRERYAEEAPTVVIVVDRRPAMSLYPPESPWLQKPVALRYAVELIVASAAISRGLVGYLDFADGDAFWRSPRSQRDLHRVDESDILYEKFEAPEDNLEHAFAHLQRARRSLPPGTFVFVLSDFLVTPPEAVWLRVRELRWDVIPVVVQDPVWEQSFPDVGGIVVPVVDPRTGKRGGLWLTQHEAARRRERNERHLAELGRMFRELDMEPVVVSSSARDDVLASFLGWADERVLARGGEWRP